MPGIETRSIIRHDHDYCWQIVTLAYFLFFSAQFTGTAGRIVGWPSNSGLMWHERLDFTWKSRYFGVWTFGFIWRQWAVPWMPWWGSEILERLVFEDETTLCNLVYWVTRSSCCLSVCVCVCVCVCVWVRERERERERENAETFL